MDNKNQELEALVKRQLELSPIMDMSFPTEEAFKECFEKDPYKSQLMEYGQNQKRIKELSWALKTDAEKKEHRIDLIKFEVKYGNEEHIQNLLKYMEDYVLIIDLMDNLLKNPNIDRDFAKYINDIKDELQKKEFVGIHGR